LPLGYPPPPALVTFTSLHTSMIEFARHEL
jgi:hypothetical protein